MNNFFPQLWKYMKSESSYHYKIYHKEDRFKVSSTAEDKVFRFCNCLIRKGLYLLPWTISHMLSRIRHWSLYWYRSIRTNPFHLAWWKTSRCARNHHHHHQ